MNRTGSIAKQFTVYSQLGWFGKWQFRHFLKWASRDAVSVELLLDFERKLEKKSLSSRQIADIITDALIWYNREDHDDRIQNRLQTSRLPEMLEIVIIFLERSHKLHHSYRELLLGIIYSGDNFGKDDEAGSGVTPEQFRLEAAKAISNLMQQWGVWHQYYKDEADRTLGCLEDIAHKANDSQQFTTVFRDIVSVIGFKATSSLMEMSRDFDEFESYFHRINTQINLWGGFPGNILTPETISELHQSLVFLETITKDTRVIEYVRYVPANNRVWKSHVSFARIVGNAYSQQVWKRTSEHDKIIEDLCRRFEENIVNEYLGFTWLDLFASTSSRHSSRYKIRWEFDKFTEYIPYEERTQDWTVDSERTRRYWNWHDAYFREHRRFSETLSPRLHSLFRDLTLAEITGLFGLFPSYIGVQEFSKTVNIPVKWTRSIEIREVYTKWTGFYDEEVEAARPREFAPHVFVFERPYLQNAIDLLDNVDEIREAIQTHRDSRY
jgi:hypothetical protein